MTSPAKATTVQVAVVQAGAVPFDTEACVDKTVRLIEEAAATGARVIVFPEAFIPGYPKGLNYGHVVGAPDGRLLGKHRKLMPTALERIIWGCGDGSTLTVVDSPYGRIGAVICWENYMPMLRMAMYSKDVVLYCAPTADDRDTWLPSMQHVALEGRCFVLTACQLVRKRDFPDTVRVSLGDSPDAVLMRGGSAIISPLGEVLAGPHFDGETILTASLDLQDIGRGKFDFDVVGHYSRPDVFRLIVNEAPTTAVLLEREDGKSALKLP